MTTPLEQYVSGMGKLARERENGRYDRPSDEADQLNPDEQAIILWVTKMECGILDDTTPEELSDEQAEVLGYHLTSGEDN